MSAQCHSCLPEKIAEYPLPKSDDKNEYGFNMGEYQSSMGQLFCQGDSDRFVWFNRGLLWLYGYNHEEAMSCLAQSALAATACPCQHCLLPVLSYWLIAYCEGPNYNKKWEAFTPHELLGAVTKARKAIQKAEEIFTLSITALSTSTSTSSSTSTSTSTSSSCSCRSKTSLTLEEKKGLLENMLRAIKARYYNQGEEEEEEEEGEKGKVKELSSSPSSEELARWNDNFAVAMRQCLALLPEDMDMVTLCAESLITRTPWALWDLKTGEPQAGADTVEAQQLLERFTAQLHIPRHPGLLHLYIHVMEQSAWPERALRACDVLRELVPDSGHLCHMPSHIDILCGHYYTALVANERAVAADRRFLARYGPLNFYSLYRCHDLHFKLYAAFFMGQLAPALAAAEELEATIPDSLLRVEEPPMADWLEGFLSVKVHCLIRFGQWQALLELPLPADQRLYAATTAMLHYGKGIAYAATGQVQAAEAQQALLLTKLHGDGPDRVPESRYLFANRMVDILAVAEHMLAGEIEYRKGQHQEAYCQLRRAVELEDGLPYDEPWGWMQPVRHALGALLLEQGFVDLAEPVYRADLGLDATLQRSCHHPDNVWSLIGYVECLRKQNRLAEAHIFQLRLDLALAHSDQRILYSCFCRLNP